jgi:hypothetical protein
VAKTTRRDSTTFGVDTVEPGSNQIASQLRQVFEVTQRFPVDVSTTIVPVVLVKAPEGALSVTPADRAWINADVNADNAGAAALGIWAAHGILNPGQGVVHIDTTFLLMGGSGAGDFQGVIVDELELPGFTLDRISPVFPFDTQEGTGVVAVKGSTNVAPPQGFSMLQVYNLYAAQGLPIVLRPGQSFWMTQKDQPGAGIIIGVTGREITP